ncbi:MAG: ComF family protein [Elusimicrobiota bacterium]|jgi:ComF family protein
MDFPIRPHYLSRLWQYILRFFMPWACAGCRTALAELEDVGFCGRCWLSIPRLETLVCRLCGVPLKDGGRICFSCRNDPSSILIRAAVTYTGIIPDAIYRFKYAGRRSMADSLSLLMASAFERYPELQPVDLLLPVPLHPKNEHVRGYNQAALLAQCLSRRIRIPSNGKTLIRLRRTRPQFKLGRPSRRSNLKEAFGLHPNAQAASTLRKRTVLLIDDICTTGTTLTECARLLRGTGAAEVKALVLARDL